MSCCQFFTVVCSDQMVWKSFKRCFWYYVCPPSSPSKSKVGKRPAHVNLLFECIFKLPMNFYRCSQTRPYHTYFQTELVLFAVTKSCHFSQSTCRSLRLMSFQEKQEQGYTMFHEVVKNAKVSKRKVCSLLGPLKTILGPLKTIFLSVNGERNIGRVCVSKIMPIAYPGWSPSCLVWFWE